MSAAIVLEHRRLSRILFTTTVNSAAARVEAALEEKTNRSSLRCGPFLIPQKLSQPPKNSERLLFKVPVLRPSRRTLCRFPLARRRFFAGDPRSADVQIGPKALQKFAPLSRQISVATASSTQGAVASPQLARAALHLLFIASCLTLCPQSGAAFAAARSAPAPRSKPKAARYFRNPNAVSSAPAFLPPAPATAQRRWLAWHARAAAVCPARPPRFSGLLVRGQRVHNPSFPWRNVRQPQGQPYPSAVLGAASLQRKGHRLSVLQSAFAAFSTATALCRGGLRPSSGKLGVPKARSIASAALAWAALVSWFLARSINRQVPSIASRGRREPAKLRTCASVSIPCGSNAEGSTRLCRLNSFHLPVPQAFQPTARRLHSALGQQIWGRNCLLETGYLALGWFQLHGLRIAWCRQ